MGFEKECPCCKGYKDGLEFKKVMQLEQSGLVIYRHTTTVHSVASVSQPEKAFNTKDNVFIIHNTKNRNVTTSSYMSEFEQAVNCPRCKYIVKHIKELLVNIPFIRKKDVIGICDHCRFTKRINERCNKCQVVVDDFLKKQELKQIETRDSEKPEKVMISKIQHILKDVPKGVFGKPKTQPRSETSVKNRSLSYKTSPTYPVVRVKDMFDIQKKTENFNQQFIKGYHRQIETTELYKNKSDSEITFIEAKRRQKQNEPRKKILFNSTENLAWPGSLQESEEFLGLDNKHQHRLKQKLKQKIDVDLPLNRQPSRELEEYLKRESYIFNPVDYGTKILDNKHQHRLKQKLKQKIDVDLPLNRQPSRELEEYLKRESYIFNPVDYGTKILDNKHQHRLKQKLKQKIDVDLPLNRQPSRELEEYLKRESYIFNPVDYDTKRWPSEKTDIHEKKNILNIKKYQRSYDDIRDSKYDHEISKSYDGKHHSKYDQEVTKSYDDIPHLKYDQKFSKSSQKKNIFEKEDIFLRGIQEQTRSAHSSRRHSSEETLVRFASATTEHTLYKDFSYFFTKQIDVAKKPPRKHVSSSELIKDTQDMYRARAEEERIKKEQKLKEKFEAEEKKRLDKIERKKHLEEERRLKELKKKKAEDEKKKTIKIEEEKKIDKKIEEEKKVTSKHDTESQEKSVKSSKDTPGKSDSIQLKTEIKESKIDKSLKSDRDSIKSKKKLDKQEKEESMRLEKDGNLEEKLEKEEQMRKANEVKQRRKDEKEKEMANKEEQMRIAKEEKQNEKDQKEKEKANKEEQMRIAKEEKQNEKDQKEKEKANKEEQMRIAKEEKQIEKEQKEKERASKEEQMRIAKEEKQKEKVQKEKEKANKEEQMRKDKEEKQRQKEEKEKQKEQLRIDEEQKQREKEQRLKEKEVRQKEKEEKRRPKEEIKNISKDIEEPLTKKQNEEPLLANPQKYKEKSKLRKKEEEAAKKKEAHLKLKFLKQNQAVVEPESPPIQKIDKESEMKDLNINKVKIRKNSGDDLILSLVRLKQKQAHLKVRPTRLSQTGIPKKILSTHMRHKNKTKSCIICLDSELALDIENIRLNETKSKEITDIIIGPKIFKNKPSLVTKKEDKEIKPLFFASTHTEEAEDMIKAQGVIEIKTAEKEKKPPILSAKNVEQEVPKGIIRYALSDRTFIEKGWTMLPTEKVVRKMNVYRMRPAHPEFDWFEHNKNRKLICYDTGEKLAEFNDNGKGRWFYRSGKVALDYYDAEEINAQQRIIIFSSGEPDERGCSRPFAILATFDYLGNGIVFDHSGKIRLKYNQTEGVVLDRAIGPVSHWKWHTLNDPPVLQQVMIDTQMSHKDPEILKLGGAHDKKPRPDNEEMLAIEFDNFIKEKSKKLSQKFKPFQIKMKALKINEYFSLKVLDQATIYLIYRDGSTNLKLNIGMILDHQEIVDTDTAEVGEVSNSLERFPARTDSLAALQRSVAHAQRVERARVERAQRLRPSQPCPSADRLTAGLARPRPARTDHGSCPCRKPSTFNLFYDTRLI